jgi:hypothetical protein
MQAAQLPPRIARSVAACAACTRTRATVALTRCVITGSEADNVCVEQDAKADLVHCTVSGSEKGSGMAVRSGGQASAHGCVFEGNREAGISVVGGGRVVQLTGCSIKGNGLHSVFVDGDASSEVCMALLGDEANVLDVPISCHRELG